MELGLRTSGQEISRSFGFTLVNHRSLAVENIAFKGKANRQDPDHGTLRDVGFDRFDQFADISIVDFQIGDRNAQRWSTLT